MADSFVSKSTVSVLENLLDQAKEGQIIGVAFVGILRGRRPVSGFSGYASQDPYFTAGVIQDLSQALLDQAKQKVARGEI